MDKIQICNWLLTRRCNLSCSYCALVKNYAGQPFGIYPKIQYYTEWEMPTEYVIGTLGKLKKHNPNAFNIFYGGEPTLRNDLAEIVEYCNENKIYYTIITNNSNEVQPRIRALLEKVEVAGITSSVDPIIFSKEGHDDKDRVRKSMAGYERLKILKSKVEDVVAEITIDNTNQEHLYTLVKGLSDAGISSSITTIDIAKNKYYDFSAVRDPDLLVHNNIVIQKEFKKILDDKDLDVHMKDVLLPGIIKILPAELDCGIEKDVHNMTIDADGSVRLCLRIRGEHTPELKVAGCINDDGTLVPELKEALGKDKEQCCEGCNWTCMIMSKATTEKGTIDDLVHSDRRS